MPLRHSSYGPTITSMSSLCLSQKHQAPPVLASTMHPALLVGLGGAIGSVARWAISEAMPTSSNADVPWATVLVNLLGALLLGALMSSANSSVETETILFLGTGLLGAFTTMSTFGFETTRLLQEGSNVSAVIYIALNLLAPLAAWIGWTMTEAFFP